MRCELETSPAVSIKSEVIYQEHLPAPAALPAECLLIYDERLPSLLNGAFSEWLARFPIRYAVPAGEPLKDLAAFPQHVERLVELSAPLAASRLWVVALGGGSVGDFAGFFASVFKRGVPFLQIPSTWLSAIDSAHGGKNALNVGGLKNQIGTFAFARRIYLCHALLRQQPAARAREAFGELAKIAILDGGPWVQAMTDAQLDGAELIWRFLGDAVAAKERIVSQDPFEQHGERHKLNLGHTLGHVLETVHKLPHGLAVAEGLRFAIHFSTTRGLLSEAERNRMLDWLGTRFGFLELRPQLERIPQSRFIKLLIQDKKRAAADSLRFVFVRGLGQVEVTPIHILELTSEAARQGYVLAA